MKKNSRNKYAVQLAEKEGIPYSEAYKEMLDMKEATGLSFSDYYARDLHSLDPHVRFREAENIVKKNEKRKQYAAEMAENLGVDTAEVRAQIKRLNEKYGDKARLTVILFHDYELYKDNEETIEKKMGLIAERKALCDSFRTVYNTPEYEEHMQELEELYGRVLEINRSLISDTLKNRYAADFVIRYPQMAEDEGSKEDISLDYLSIRNVAGFSNVEYIMYDLYNKPLSEKLAYSSEREMLEMVRIVNDPEIRYLLDDKYSCYRKLTKYYGRELIFIKKEWNAGEAEAFFRKNRLFVKKPCYSRQGRGIRVVDTGDYSSTAEMIDSLLKEDGDFVAEGLVTGHPRVNAFNPDSLNTIRIVTFNAGKKIPGIDDSCESVKNGMICYAGRGIYCCAAFFKTGREGSFVDNIGAGACFSSVDLKTGESSVRAYDENGVEYEVHPDSGENFRSLRFDSIRKAIALAKSSALKITGAKIIGWDFALTDRNKWVMIEGNYSPTLLAQAPAECGIHKEVRMMIDAVRDS